MKLLFRLSSSGLKKKKRTADEYKILVYGNENVSLHGRIAVLNVFKSGALILIIFIMVQFVLLIQLMVHNKWMSFSHWNKDYNVNFAPWMGIIWIIYSTLRSTLYIFVLIKLLISVLDSFCRLGSSSFFYSCQVLFSAVVIDKFQFQFMIFIHRYYLQQFPQSLPWKFSWLLQSFQNISGVFFQLKSLWIPSKFRLRFTPSNTASWTGYFPGIKCVCFLIIISSI